MVVTDYGKSGLALRIVSSGAPPDFLALGSGSGIFTTIIGSLYGEVKFAVAGSDRVSFTTRDIATQKEVTWTWDKSSTAMSGIVLSEFGTVSVSGGADKLWMEEGFVGITFDGTNELQVQISKKIF